MDLNPLERVAARIAENPRFGPSLVLYSLVKTLSTGKGQYMFLLSKLRDLDEADRRLAYGLMEAMAEGLNETPEWRAGVERIDVLLRG